MWIAALLVFTAWLALIPTIHFAIIEQLPHVPWILSIRMFVILSLATYFVQLPAFLTSDLTMIIVFKLTVVAWLFALLNLNRKRVFSIYPASMNKISFNIKDSMQNEEYKNKWDWVQRFLGSAITFHQGTLMRGHPIT